jgi:hypothetical protein
MFSRVTPASWHIAKMLSRGVPGEIEWLAARI